jgi:predicted Zn-dependent peptidase
VAELIELSNGVRLVIDPNPALETAALGVWFRAGAIDEKPDEHGVAHLLEHMAFKGTQRRTARQIADEIETVGGYLNASTGYSRTGYYARVLKDDVPLAFDILGDILNDPALDEGELAKEQEVVVQEIGEAADQPDDAVMEQLQALAFRGHALARPILGTEQSVRSQTPESLRSFIARAYAPAHTVVAVSGAFDVDAAKTCAARLFGARSGEVREFRVAKPRHAGGFAHDARDIEQTHIALGFPGAPAPSPDYIAVRVFVEALGGGMSSRIFQRVREERGLAYSVYAYTDGYDDIGLSGAYVGADAQTAPEAVALIRAEIEDMASAADEKEVARARAMLKSTMLMALESPGARIDAAAAHLFTHGRLLDAREMAARIDAVTVDDVRKAAAAALAGGALSVAIVGPADGDAVWRAAGA